MGQWGTIIAGEPSASVACLKKNVHIDSATTTINLFLFGRKLDYTILVPNPRKPRAKCFICQKETARAGYIYCSNACQSEHKYQSYINKWKQGQVLGLIAIGVVSGHVKRYLREKFGNKCCLCGWSKVNPVTGKVPLVADHIDGDWRNNLEENLRLLCPNCDSLTPTYAALNKGRGRINRKLSKRNEEAHILIKNRPA